MTHAKILASLIERAGWFEEMSPEALGLRTKFILPAPI